MGNTTKVKKAAKAPSRRPLLSNSQRYQEKIKRAANNEERLKILKSLAEIREPWACEVLLETLADPNERIREFLIRTLGEREDLDLERVCQKLHSPPWYAKSGCLKILGLKKDPRMVPHIRAALKDPNTDLRVTAAEVLGEIGGQQALAVLAELSKDGNRFVRVSAERALLKASSVKFS